MMSKKNNHIANMYFKKEKILFFSKIIFNGYGMFLQLSLQL